MLKERRAADTVKSTKDQHKKVQNCKNKDRKCELKQGMARKYSSLGPSVSLRASPRWRPFLSSAATNVSKLLVVSVAIAAAVITAVSVHNLYPVEDPITPIGYLDRQVNSIATAE